MISRASAPSPTSAPSERRLVNSSLAARPSQSMKIALEWTLPPEDEASTSNVMG